MKARPPFVQRTADLGIQVDVGNLAAMPEFPSRLAAAGVLITGPDDLSLLVRTHNREALVLPGGMVEPNESPAVAAEREVREELGLELRVTRLLAVQHRVAEDVYPERLMFVFDTDPLLERPTPTLQEDEIAEVFWLTPTEAIARHTAGGRDRLDAAFAARLAGVTTYVDAERELPPTPRS